MTVQATAAPLSALVVANPAAGGADGIPAAEVARLCESVLGGAAVRVHRTTGRGDASLAAFHAATGADGTPPDVVVAVGGDGTVREVVEGLAGRGPATRTCLAVVPAGTGNSVYKMLWGERPWPTTLRAALHGARGDVTVRRLDLAHIAETGADVLLGACSGVIAQALETARSIPLTGRARYARAFTETAAAFRPYPGRVTVDGAVLYEGPTVLANVGGGQYRGGRYRVLPHSVPDDGLLDVCVIGGDIPPADVPALTEHAGHLDLPGVAYGRGRRIVVERTDGAPLVFEHDGELQPRDRRRITLEVRPGVLPCWAPAHPEPQPAGAHGALAEARER